MPRVIPKRDRRQSICPACAARGDRVEREDGTDGVALTFHCPNCRHAWTLTEAAAGELNDVGTPICSRCFQPGVAFQVEENAGFMTMSYLCPACDRVWEHKSLRSS
jgi:hypothetical protein